MFDTSFIRDQSIGVVGLILCIPIWVFLGSFWLYIPYAFRVGCVLYFFPPVADSLYPQNMSQGGMGLSKCPRFFCFLSERDFSFLGQLEHSPSILIHVSILFEAPPYIGVSFTLDSVLDRPYYLID